MKFFLVLLVGTWSAGPRRSRPGIEEISWRIRQQHPMPNPHGETKFILGGYENERCSSSSRSRSPECREPDFTRMTQKSIAKWLLRQGSNRHKTNHELAFELAKLVEKATPGGQWTQGALTSTISRARKDLSAETGEDWSAPLTQQKSRMQSGSSEGAQLAHMSKGEIAVMLLRRNDNRSKTSSDLVPELRQLIKEQSGVDMDDRSLQKLLSEGRNYLVRHTN